MAVAFVVMATIILINNSTIRIMKIGHQVTHHDPSSVDDKALGQVKLIQLCYLCFVYYPLCTITYFFLNNCVSVESVSRI